MLSVQDCPSPYSFGRRHNKKSLLQWPLSSLLLSAFKFGQISGLEAFLRSPRRNCQDTKRAYNAIYEFDLLIFRFKICF